MASEKSRWFWVWPFDVGVVDDDAELAGLVQNSRRGVAARLSSGIRSVPLCLKSWRASKFFLRAVLHRANRVHDVAQDILAERSASPVAVRRSMPSFNGP